MPPLAGGAFADAVAVAGRFVAAEYTWTSPDGPRGAAARVAPYATSAVIHQLEVGTGPAPPGLAAPNTVTRVTGHRVVAADPDALSMEVTATGYDEAQDGRLLGPTSPVHVRLELTRAPDGAWLVSALGAGP